MKTTKKSAVLILALAMVFMLFGITASAEGELTFGDYSYVLLEDGSVKITEYNGTGKAVTVPDKIDGRDVTVIGSFAFSQERSVESLVIPGSVKEIEYDGIYFCERLTTVTVQEGALESLGNTSIELCAALKTLNLPSNVRTIGTLIGCHALNNIVISSDSAYLKNVDGVIYSADMKTLIKYPQGKIAAEYYIPTTVTKIAKNAFYEVRNPVKVYIPLTVKTIEGLPFGYSRVSLYYEGSSMPESWKAGVEGFKFYVNSYKPGKTEKITSAPGENSIKLSWTAVYGANCYNVYQQTSSGWKKLAEVKNTSYTVNNTKYGTKYTFAVKAGKKSGNKITWSGIYTTHATVANIPATVKVTSTPGATTIKLTWTPVKGVDGYRVFYKNASGWKATADVKSTTYTYKKLKTATEYTFAIKAYKKVSGKIFWSNVYTTHATSTKPAKPSKVSASQDTNWIQLSWNECKGATAYRIYHKKGNGWVVSKSSVTGTSYTFKNLKAGSKFTFAVRPYIQTDNTTVWGDYTIYTASVKPAEPTFTIKVPQTGHVTVKWNAVVGADEYKVYYKRNNGPFKLYKTYTSAGSQTFTNLLGGDVYEFTVRAGVKTTAGTVLSTFTPKSITISYKTPRYLNLFKKGVFRVKYTAAGETVTLTVKDDGLLLDFVDAEGSNVSFLHGYVDGWRYINHTYEIMARLTDKTAAGLFTAESLVSDINDVIVPEVCKHGRAVFAGKTRQTESYTKGAVTYTYFYNGATLVGIEMKDNSGQKETITIHSITDKVSDKLFAIPNYDEYAPI